MAPDEKYQTRGRKPASESKLEEIRVRLLAWRQEPESQKVSLRALAVELGTSHQLLSFHLSRLDEWQYQENQRKGREISQRAIAERRSMTPQEEAQRTAYDRASLSFMLDVVFSKAFRQMRKQLKRGELSGIQVKFARILAEKGHPEARTILNQHARRQNNLPPHKNRAAKSCRFDSGSVATPLKPSSEPINKIKFEVEESDAVP